MRRLVVFVCLAALGLASCVTTFFPQQDALFWAPIDSTAVFTLKELTISTKPTTGNLKQTAADLTQMAARKAGLVLDAKAEGTRFDLTIALEEREFGVDIETYNKKLYDDRGSFIKSPTLKDVAMTGVGIAATLATGGLGAGASILATAAMTTAADAVFTTADVAHGADAGQEWGAFGKRAAITGATTAFSLGVGALGSIAGSAVGQVAGEVGVGISKAVQAGVTAGGNRLISTAINSLDWQNGHIGFDSSSFGNAWDTSNISNYSGIMTAMAGSVGSSLGSSFGSSLADLTKWNSKLTGAIGNDVGMIAGQAIGYGASMAATTIQNGGFSQNTWGQSLDNMGGLNANLVNAGMLLQMAGGAIAMTSGNKYNPDDYRGLYEAAGKLSNTGLFEVSLSSGGASGSFSGGGVNLGGAVWDTAQYGYGQANIEAQLKNMTQSDARQTLTDLYSNGDYAAEALVNRLGAGIDKVAYANQGPGGQAVTTTTDTGRLITLDNSYSDHLGAMGAVVLSHEAWRSGTVADAAMQQAKTNDAVMAHIGMADAMARKYGIGSLSGQAAQEVMALQSGNTGLLAALVGSYDSSGEYWKLTKNKDGKVTKVENDNSNDVTTVDENGNQTGFAKYDGSGRTAFLAGQIGNGMTAAQASQMLAHAGYSYNADTGKFDGNVTAKQAFDLTGDKNLTSTPTVVNSGASSWIDAVAKWGQGVASSVSSWFKAPNQAPNAVADINSRIRDGDATGILPLENPCLMQAFDGNAQSAVGKNLNTNGMVSLVNRLAAGDDPAISETYYVNDPKRVIQEALRQLGEDPQNYNIQVGIQGGPRMEGATGSVLAVSRQDDTTKVGHYEEGDAMGNFRWDPISGNSQGGRVVFPNLTRWVKIEKQR